MKRIILGFIGGLMVFVGVFYYLNQKQQTAQLEEFSNLIQLQLENVGKLVVTEAAFSEVFSYEDSKDYFKMISFKKKTLVIVNAKVTVGFDLSKLETYIDKENKEVHITYVPDEEINIYPELFYYDITQDYFNQFEAKDLNKIKKKVDALLQRKIEQSQLKDNAKNRLISELQKVYFLTSSMGWSLHYNAQEVESDASLENLMWQNFTKID